MSVIIFDFNRTIYDPETGDLTLGAMDLLEALHGGNILVLLGKGDEERRKLVAGLGVENYFDKIIIKMDKGVEDYEAVRDSYPEADDFIVVGDRIKKEIVCGNKAGMKTIWFRSGKFSDEVPSEPDEEPNHIIKNLGEVEGVLGL